MTACLPDGLNRREWLMLTWAAGVTWNASLFAQPPAVSSALAPLNRFPRMMQEYLGTRVAASQKMAELRQARLTTKEDAEAHVQNVREMIRQSFGPFPDRTPLKPRITRIVQRDAYKIENVIFESRPGFLVTANLYVPTGRKWPLPGVVGSCGHSTNGKAADAYQSFAQGLARQGYVVLIFDPIGQGERIQYLNEDHDKSTVGVGVGEHLLGGNQQFLIGEFFGSWRAWDGMRALDYLLTREEVDPKHVGITGNSGGGTMTMWLSGVEPRWTMSAPSCAVTTFRRNFENELPADTEQCPPLALKLGLDHGDFLAAMAPRPVIILATEQDFFDARGSTETWQRLKKLWGLLGAEQNIRLFIGPNEHGYTRPNREAMYGFFNEQTHVADGNAEPDLVIEKDETLWCTPRGQVEDLGSRTLFSLTQATSRELAAQRGLPDAAKVRRLVEELIPARPTTAPDYEILRPISGRKYPRPHSTTYAVQTEPGIRAIVYRLAEKPRYSSLPPGPGRCILYVSHQSSDIELRENPFLKELINTESDAEFYTVDVRGIGDSRPDTCGANQFLTPYGSDYFYAAHSIMLGESYPVQRAFDVLRVIAWLKSAGRTEVHLVANGWGTIPATLAAVVSDDVHQVTLQHALTSWTSVAETEHYKWPLSSMIPGVLKSFDLPDCYRALADKNLNQVEPWDATATVVKVD
ncbi:MAG: acetylxylan esterase [Planctomycetes bacterium]|nr:acetylxylan esterase [Planctomycetota bacterium]